MSANGRKAKAALIQGPIRHQHNAYHAGNNALEDMILTKTGIACSVKVTPDLVKIHAPSYPDYILAKAAIKNQVSAEIVRA
jgi:hypothetical protein